MFSSLELHWLALFFLAFILAAAGTILWIVGAYADWGGFEVPFLMVGGILLLISNIPFWAGSIGLICAILRWLGV